MSAASDRDTGVAAQFHDAMFGPGAFQRAQEASKRKERRDRVLENFSTVVAFVVLVCIAAAAVIGVIALAVHVL